MALATEFVFRLPTIRFADAHARAAGPDVGTFCYLFTWESPAFGGILGSCHALDIPFVFGTVHNPAVQVFAGGGDDAFALSPDHAARTGPASPGPVFRVGQVRRVGPTGRIRPAERLLWFFTGLGELGRRRRPTTVLGPWPQTRAFVTGSTDHGTRSSRH